MYSLKGKIDLGYDKVNIPKEVLVLRNHDHNEVVGKCECEYKDGKLVVDGELVEPLQFHNIDIGFQVVEAVEDQPKEVNLIEVSIVDISLEDLKHTR
ncbi:hypothetical protein [Fodinibius sp. SL11]|uniref:hypothetical protein n=1 Tax=Fodinibius sp. SL11 TaxID=3425690 RepID=UPI003F88268C